jgi:hypothetical protein
MGGGFALFPALFAPDPLGGCVVSADIEPAGERGVAAEGGRFSSEGDEDLLSDIIGRVDISADTPQGRGMNQAQMAVDQFGECGLGAVCDKPVEQFSVGTHGGFVQGCRRTSIRTK